MFIPNGFSECDVYLLFYLNLITFEIIHFSLGGSGFDPPRWFDEESPPENMVESEFSFVFIAKKRKNNFSYGTALAMELVYQRLNNLDKYLSTKYSRELVEKRELPEVLLTFMPKLSFFPLYLLYIHWKWIIGVWLGNWPALDVIRFSSVVEEAVVSWVSAGF
ncbi:hypothetical protein WN944_003999 [Citrus x changshan-huyou]|uniref:Uncharacterized protein n=1 Tax=Citrus x changshan-huyou TaxID=2935761 RepID=A0AAP0QFZ0_9ROSI